LVLALVAFVLAAIGWTYRKTDLIAVGLALLTLSFLIPRLSHLSLGTVFLLLAFLAFIAAAIGWRYRKINLIAVGLAFYTLTFIVS
jgi:hydrogenase-4 membrane subunit HyfE